MQPLKHLSFSLQFFCLSICFLYSSEAKATHAAGGELLYEWVSDSTYHFYFKFYRDCTGAPELATINVCIRNNCNLYAQSYPLTKMASPLPNGKQNGHQINTGCPSFPPKCVDPTSTLPAFNEWWYEGIASIPGKCAKWIFGIAINARNPSQNITTTDFYIESVLNNLDFPHNNSAVFSVAPVPFTVINAPYTYNNGAFDSDGDSLVTNIIRPQTGTCWSANNTGISSGISFPTNPLSCNNTFVLNTATGAFSFTPNLLGAHTLTQRVEEYKNGKLKGSVLRDVQIQVLPAANTAQTNSNVDSKTVVNASLINSTLASDCGASYISFCFDIVADIPGTVLKLTDNKNIVMPAATLTYTNQGKDSVRGCFTWHLVPGDTGLKTLVVIVKDSTCKPPGIAFTKAFTFPVKINPPNGVPLSVTLKKNADTICEGSSLTVNNLFTNNPSPTIYGWAVDDADSIKGNNPYIITWKKPGFKNIKLTAVNGDCVAKDSTAVYIISKPLADFKLPANACIHDSVSLYPAFSELSSYHWTLDEASITDTFYSDEYRFVWNTPGKKIVRLKIRSLKNCGDTAYDDQIIIRNPQATILGLDNPYYCLGEPLSIYAAESGDNNYNWTPVTEFMNNNSAEVTYLSRMSGKINLTITDLWGCQASDSTEIIVKECCKLYTPGAFTPNADGYNDKFSIINPKEYTAKTFIIKNRWGNTVFESRDINAGWDGTYKGIPQDPGTYFYFIQYTCPMKQETFSKGGDLILIR